jgi:cephalosporin-C deacetylase-like acetyl esterase
MQTARVLRPWMAVLAVLVASTAPCSAEPAARVTGLQVTPVTFSQLDLQWAPAPLCVYQDSAERRQARAMLGAYVGKALDRLVKARRQELAALATPEAWRQRQHAVRRRLTEFLGDFGPKCPLCARTVGKLDRPDYVIEKVIFESQPGYFCTTNLYVPKRRQFPRPGVLLTCGHAAEGKAYRLYHEACLGLVLKGYVVLALDPTGQGERSEYFDPTNGKPTVPLTVSQHHYLARPSWLVGRTLVGYRTWDAIRAVDYLVSRPEVNPEQIAAVGNSGGGMMGMLVTACDERVKVCAVDHPGGSMEQTFLTGQRLTEADILSLIPPRPCAIVVGRDSGEIPGHQAKLDDMLLFYRGLGADPRRAQLFVVDGIHDMKQPKRLVHYAWLNQWLHQEKEGTEEPPLKPESESDLNCTATGFVVRDLHGETGQTLNAKLAETLRPPRATPKGRDAIVAVQSELRSTVARRIGLTLPAARPVPRSTPCGRSEHPDILAEKLILDSEEGIRLPALLLRPRKAKPAATLVLHVAEIGKPADPGKPSLVLELVRKGFTVFSLDVRGAGETDPRNRPAMKPLEFYDPQQFQFDSCAVRCAGFGTTLLAMQAFDVIRANDYLAARSDLARQRVVLLGEGLGGVWTLAAAAFDPRPAGVITVGTVPSYKLIVGAQYYASRDYFWVPGALRDFDLPDLVALAAPRPAILVDPADAMLAPLRPEACQAACAWPLDIYRGLGVPDSLRVIHTARESIAQVADAVAGALEAL